MNRRSTEVILVLVFGSVFLSLGSFATGAVVFGAPDARGFWGSMAAICGAAFLLWAGMAVRDIRRLDWQ